MARRSRAAAGWDRRCRGRRGRGGVGSRVGHCSPAPRDRGPDDLLGRTICRGEGIISDRGRPAAGHTNPVTCGIPPRMLQIATLPRTSVSTCDGWAAALGSRENPLETSSSSRFLQVRGAPTRFGTPPASQDLRCKESGPRNTPHAKWGLRLFRACGRRAPDPHSPRQASVGSEAPLFLCAARGSVRRPRIPVKTRRPLTTGAQFAYFSGLGGLRPLGRVAPASVASIGRAPHS